MNEVLDAIFFILFTTLVVMTVATLIAAVIVFGRMLLVSKEMIGKEYFRFLKALPSKSMPHFFDQDDESVVAYRTAYLVFQDGIPKFASVFRKTTFGKTERAQCNWAHKNSHTCPGENCSCGFYALTEAHKLPRRTLIRFRYGCTLQVQLSGKYIPGTDGYRAERQDVLCAWIPARCAVFRCHEPAVKVAASENLGQDEVPAAGKAAKVLVPICETHAKRYNTTFSLLDLRNQLQTEFRWMR